MADYNCQMQGTFFDESQWSTGLHITSNQTPAALATTWSNAVSNMWSNATYGLHQFYPVDTILRTTTVATLDGTMHETSKILTDTPVAGTASGDTLPLQNATLISLRTNFIGRTQRGRMFLPAMEETFVNNDVLTPAAAALVKQAVQSLFAAINADGSTVFIYVHPNKLKPPTIPVYTKSTISLPLVSNKPARQSRRTRRKKPVYT